MAKCPRCGSDHISYQVVQTGAVTNTKKRGCLFGIGRLILIICTCGLWLLFGRKKYRSKTSFSNQKVAICQNCGHSWSV